MLAVLLLIGAVLCVALAFICLVTGAMGGIAAAAASERAMLKSVAAAVVLVIASVWLW